MTRADPEKLTFLIILQTLKSPLGLRIHTAELEDKGRQHAKSITCLEFDTEGFNVITREMFSVEFISSIEA